MAIANATSVNGIIDNCCGIYLAILGTNGSGLGYGTGASSWGASTKATNVQTVVGASGDFAFISQMSTAVLQLASQSTGIVAAGGDVSNTLFALQLNIINNSPSATVVNLDSYLTYLNTNNSGSYWAALQNPAWATLGGGWFNGKLPSPWNVYADSPSANTVAPVYSLGLGTHTVGSSFVAHDVIDATKYAGGVPAIVASSITGSGVVTVTGTARDPANYQTTVAGVTWTATVSGNGTVALTPGTAPADSLILAVSAITIAAGITVGTIQAISQAPAGRPSEP